MIRTTFTVVAVKIALESKRFARYPSAMKKNCFLIILALVLGGCQAHMMETHGDKIVLFSPQGRQPGRGGVVRYLNTGFHSWRNARRNDALKQMSGFCRGAYDVTAEGPRSKFGADMPIGDKVSFEADEYWYMRFECRQSQPKP